MEVLISFVIYSFLTLFNCGESFTQEKISSHMSSYMFGETHVLVGYEKKYSFSVENLIDFILFPVEEKGISSLYVISLHKRFEPSEGSELVLSVHDGFNFQNVSSIPVGNIDRIKYHAINRKYYVMVGGSHESSYIYRVNTALNVLEKVIEYPSKYASNFIVWSNAVSKKTYLLITFEKLLDSNGVKYITRNPIYVWEADERRFSHIGYIECDSPAAARSFEIGNMSFVAVANSKNDYGETSIYSNIYYQDSRTGKLHIQQNIFTQGAAESTYFCFDSGSSSEHFLIFENKKERKNGSQVNSIIYKWSEDGYFIPFQSLDVSSTQIVSMTGENGEFILLAWSNGEGLIVYQYDGWKFTRSEAALNKKDYKKTLFVNIRVLEIEDKFLFSLITTLDGKNTVEMYDPTFKLDTQFGNIYWNILQRLTEISTEIKSLKAIHPSNIILKQIKIKRANFELNISSINNLQNTPLKNGSKELIQAWSDKISQSLSEALRNSTRNSKIMQELVIHYDEKNQLLNQHLSELDVRILDNNNGTHMQGKSSEGDDFQEYHYQARAHHLPQFNLTTNATTKNTDFLIAMVLKDTVLEDKHSFEDYEDEISYENTSIPIVLTNVLDSVKAVALVQNNNSTELKMVTVQGDKYVTIHPWDSTNKRFDFKKGIKTELKLSDDMVLTKFSPVNLYDGIGVYIEGEKGNRVIGQVYRLSARGSFRLGYRLPVENNSIVAGLPLAPKDQCFVIALKNGSSCFFFCPDQSLHGYFSCNNVSQVFVVGEGQDADILLMCEKKVVIWLFEKERKRLIRNQDIYIDPGSSISASYNNRRSYISVLSSSNLWIYRKRNGFYVVWKQFLMSNFKSSVVINALPQPFLIVYKLNTQRSKYRSLLDETPFLLAPDNNTHCHIFNTYQYKDMQFNIMEFRKAYKPTDPNYSELTKQFMVLMADFS